MPKEEAMPTDFPSGEKATPFTVPLPNRASWTTFPTF
jgi:hypothetical protein